MSISSKLGFSQKEIFGKGKTPPTVVVLTAICCALLPLDTSQLLLTVCGAVVYALVEAATKRSKISSCRTFSTSRGEKPLRQDSSRVLSVHTCDAWMKSAKNPRCETSLNCARPKTETRKPSSMPVAPPTFVSDEWDMQVSELLRQISPKPHGDRAVQELAHFVQRTLRSVLPEAEVVGFANADISRRTAFGVAVPEVDIVVNVKQKALMERMCGLAQRDSVRTVDMTKLQKAAIRLCTERLVSNSGFKFRRSAFRSQEPKVTLLVPTSLGLFEEALPIDFSVNTNTPGHNATLIAECARADPRARDLILLVRRWAKDRGVCHAAKGHLSPYAWTLLTIYFLQVGLHALLPTYEQLRSSCGRVGSGQIRSKTSFERNPPCDLTTPVSKLFKEFVAFYCKEFDWYMESVSIRRGCREWRNGGLPNRAMPDGEDSVVGPIVEDPFDVTRNHSSNMTPTSLARLRQELMRAHEYCCQGVSLTDLLLPWVPPEHDGTETKTEEVAAQAPSSVQTRPRYVPPMARCGVTGCRTR
uniref:PAP-associated domain-containing protein n=1 Tax=Noctiluca scintillans TaxID=2966 RepID=A0A7S1AMH4_NOCSC|mmetsp:Transcript_52492/g.139773  ORF Transcript_52492/g.139773 Transcript_52492/m.139773 type:complete len:529 (+) Transcript_52492:85-1671(+)